MPGADPEASLVEAIRSSGLVGPGDRGVVMVSGGADSGCLLTGLARAIGPERLVALHVNYGLREEAGADEELVRGLCAGLEVELEVVAAGRPEGNLQAWAREIRHRESERVRAERDMGWIAVGHTRSDQAETFLYRLAVSPGARPLLAMPPRSGHLIRPLLALSRQEVREIARLAGVPFSDDATNQDPAFARNRIRQEVMPALREINPAAELNVGRTRAELEEDEDLLLRLAGEAWAPGPGEGLPAEVLIGGHPALRRRMLRLLAERELGRPVAVPPGLAAEAARLCGEPEGGELDLGRGASLRVESGLVRVHAGPDEPVPPEPIVAGETSFGEWSIRSGRTSPEEAKAGFGSNWACFLEGEPGLVVRGRRDGDRIGALGMTGSRNLGDLFSEAGVPRSRRASWPVVEADGEIVWVPGLARSRDLLVGEGHGAVTHLEATPPFSI